MAAGGWHGRRPGRRAAGGTFLTTWGSHGLGNGQFSVPTGVATDATGHVYVTDEGNNRIQKFDASGAFLTKWGSSGSGNGQLNLSHRRGDRREQERLRRI